MINYTICVRSKMPFVLLVIDNSRHFFDVLNSSMYTIIINIFTSHLYDTFFYSRLRDSYQVKMII